MPKPKTPNDQAALDNVRAHLTSIGAGRVTGRRRPVGDGELAHLDVVARRAELRRRYQTNPFTDDAA